MQDTVRKHSYFTMLNVHVDSGFRGMVADMKLRDAEKVVILVLGFRLFVCFRQTELLIKNEQINLMENFYCRSSPFFSFIFIIMKKVTD